MAQVHSDKPYKCDCCQAAFRYKGNLASHKTVHTGESTWLVLHPLPELRVVSVFQMADLVFQGRSHITATYVELSSTDQPTSKPTLASTLAKSRTSVTHVVPDLFRWGGCVMKWPAFVFVELKLFGTNVFFFNSLPGGPSSCSRVNPHRRETVSLWDLWNTLPPPPDP